MDSGSGQGIQAQIMLSLKFPLIALHTFSEAIKFPLSPARPFLYMPYCIGEDAWKNVFDSFPGGVFEFHFIFYFLFLLSFCTIQVYCYNL